MDTTKYTCRMDRKAGNYHFPFTKYVHYKYDIDLHGKWQRGYTLLF